MNLDAYDTVDDRLHDWWAAHPNGRVSTRIEHIYPADQGRIWSVVVSSALYADKEDTHPTATGLASEHAKDRGPVDKAVWLIEVAETSSLGRALANAGYSTKGARPSRAEMQKVADVAATKTTAPHPPGRSEAARGVGGPSPKAAAGGVPNVAPPAPPNDGMGAAVNLVEQELGGTPLPPSEKRTMGVGGNNYQAETTKAQWGKALALCTDVGLVLRDDTGSPVVKDGRVQVDWPAIATYASDVLGHTVTTLKGLNRGQMSELIDALARDAAAQENAAVEAQQADPWANEQPGWV